MKSAAEVHRESMIDPDYRRAYLRSWLPNRLSILWLRLRVAVRR